MLNSDVLEVAVGLVFIYLLLSLVATSAREALEGLLKTRSKSLEAGLVELFDARSQPQLLKAFYDQPLIGALYRGDYALPANLQKKVDAAVQKTAADAAEADAAVEVKAADAVKAASRSMAGLPGMALAAWNEVVFYGNALLGWIVGRSPATSETPDRRAAAKALPSYIPPSNFALAVLNLVTRRDPAVSKASAEVTAAATATTTTMTLADLQAAANDLLDTDFGKAVRLAVSSSATVDEVQSFLEDWFNAAMDRVSGVYKRYTQGILLVLSAAMCILLNVNTVLIAEALAQNPTLRAAVTADAEGASANPDFTNAITNSANTAAANAAIDTQVSQVYRIEGLPIGWGPSAQERLGRFFPKDSNFLPTVFAGLEILAGWLITAFAIMLGAPFWFDVLGKIMVIRSTVKPAEKSGIEASKDAT